MSQMYAISIDLCMQIAMNIQFFGTMATDSVSGAAFLVTFV